jgi:hypothetical protein
MFTMRINMKKIIVFLALFVAGTAEAQVSRLDTRWITGTNLAGTAFLVGTSIYAAKDAIGDDGASNISTILFSNVLCRESRTGRITAVALSDASDNAVEYDLLLFTSAPGGTFTDNNPADPTDADLLLMMPVINLASTDHFSFNDNGISSLSSLNSSAYSLTKDATTGSYNLYGVLVSRGTPTYTADTDVKVRLAVTCD